MVLTNFARVVGAAALVAVLALAPLAAAPAAFGATPSVTIAPAPVGDQPRAAIEVSMDAGAAVQDSVVVTNHASTQARFELRAVDAANTESGTLELVPTEQKSVASGRWIAVGYQAIVLDAGASAVVPVTITVPGNIETGDYAAGLAVVESTAGGFVIDSAPDVAAQSGVAVFIAVSGIREPEVTVTGTASAFSPSWNPFAPGTFSVRYDVANSGNTRVDLYQSIVVTGPFGITFATLRPEPVLNLMPTQAVRVSAEAPGIPPLLLAWADVSVVSVKPGDPDPVTEAVAAGAPVAPTAPTPAASTDAATDAPQEPATTPEPVAEGAIVPETSTNYTVVYPEAIAHTLAPAISWTLLLIVLVVAAVLFIAIRYISGARARGYQLIDEVAARSIRQPNPPMTRGGAA